jgi:serine/threonine protein kinase/predicted Zn-dependent protease
VVAQPGAPQASAGADDDGRTRLADEPPSAPGEPTGPLKVGERFGPRYRITRVLGVGGMGAVYEAWDAELGVQVALKVIRPEVAADPSSARELERRFKRELLLARQVTHKNVVRIHDLGEINGIKYITMPYIEGDDLGTILKAEGALPIPRALSIARQALSGLVAAHEKGIVHRDLKPANIMVDSGGNALLMDFGIARSIGVPAEEISPHSHHTAPGAFGETMVGAVVGTIRYMAPEQARGQEVDHRADVYAFGLIMRDMLVGLDRQMGAPTAFAELQQRLDIAPPSVRTIDLKIPEALDKVVSRCLAPEAADRYQSAADLEAALNRLDDNGKVKPKKKVVGLPWAVAIGSALLTLTGYIYWYTRPPVVPPQVSVLIADFVNNTKDPAFDRTLEPMIKRALEGAGFITAFDREGITRTLGVQPPERLDEAAARVLANKQLVGVVLAGSIEPQGSGYRLSVKATRAVTEEVVTTRQANAAGKEQVFDVVARLAARVRRALGDEASESSQMFAMQSVSAASVDVVRYWVAGREAAANRDYEEARRNYLMAVKLDPKFGLGYQGLANVATNQTNQEEATNYVTEAVKHTASMTERERFTVRGGFYRITGDYRECVKQYSELLAAYPADVAAHNNLAVCWAGLRDFAKAVAALREVVAVVPNRPLYRTNLANMMNFASDFKAAEQEVKKIPEPDPIARVVLAFAQLGQGQFRQAEDTYKEIATTGASGASMATSGLADLANLEGRYSDAARLFEEGAARDVADKRPDLAAANFAALAHTELLRRRPQAAIEAGEKALKLYQGLNVRFVVARAFAAAGAADRARKIATGMAAERLAEPQAYAKIVEGEIALERGDHDEAIKILTDANALLDTWLGHFNLGRAYLAARLFTQAGGEFDRCLKRRGEALQLVLNDAPTYGALPPVYYYQGRVQEGQGADAADSYRQYLSFRGSSTQDPIAREIRDRGVDK